ncbi:MAG: hypothetical protein MAG715_00495 [Methanonatronarchaeales archaeon]|nr:hypothetical protein [Methanonatronarchaeales archaeon]
MTDVRLFDVDNGVAEEIGKRQVNLEKNIQTLVESNLEEFFGVRFLETEHSTGKKHGGRIDTLGIDENNSPVIIEYKRQKNENIINQGLFYFDWLMDHRGDFEILVRNQYGDDAEVDWSSPRLLCVAEDFTKYDSYAVEQMNRNIELIRYQMYENGFILFELINAVEGASEQTTTTRTHTKTFQEYYEDSNERIKEIFHELEDFMLSLGDDVQKKELKYYAAYKRLRNFACVEIRASKILIYLKVDPASLDPLPDFARDVSNIGHYGTGDLEVEVRSVGDVERVKPLIERSYGES